MLRIVALAASTGANSRDTIGLDDLSLFYTAGVVSNNTYFDVNDTGSGSGVTNGGVTFIPGRSSVRMPMEAAQRRLSRVDRGRRARLLALGLELEGLKAARGEKVADEIRRPLHTFTEPVTVSGTATVNAAKVGALATNPTITVNNGGTLLLSGSGNL